MKGRVAIYKPWKYGQNDEKYGRNMPKFWHISAM
jgi:hypothetical protein